MDEGAYLVALAAIQTWEKSTVFGNRSPASMATGRARRWPCSRRRSGTGGKSYRLVDLPGTYSLRANSKEEEVARDFIVNEDPDVVVCVVDATRAAERNLNLVLQIIPLARKCVVCLNLMDEASERGIVIDAGVLSQELGVPVVPASLRKNGHGRIAGRSVRRCDGASVPRPHVPFGNNGAQTRGPT